MRRRGGRHRYRVQKDTGTKAGGGEEEDSKWCLIVDQLLKYQYRS